MFERATESFEHATRLSNWTDQPLLIHGASHGQYSYQYTGASARPIILRGDSMAMHCAENTLPVPVTAPLPVPCPTMERPAPIDIGGINSMRGPNNFETIHNFRKRSEAQQRFMRSGRTWAPAGEQRFGWTQSFELK